MWRNAQRRGRRHGGGQGGYSNVGGERQRAAKEREAGGGAKTYAEQWWRTDVRERGGRVRVGQERQCAVGWSVVSGCVNGSVNAP